MFGSDEVLWYNPPGSTWGQLGYAVPNCAGKFYSYNNTIVELTGVIGRNLSAIMHHTDASLRKPPSINTLIRVHRLIVRARTLLSARAVPPGKLNFEPTHATPAKEVHLLFPCPFFKVRNFHLKSWAGYMFNALTEAIQHTENKIEYEISTDFAGLIGQYLQRVYVRMATELFGVARDLAEKPDFILTDAVLSSYDPGQFYTSTELMDVADVPPTPVATEDDLKLLTDGIPANLLLGVMPYPIGNEESLDKAVVSATGTFVPPPGP